MKRVLLDNDIYKNNLQTAILFRNEKHYFNKSKNLSQGKLII